MGDDTDLELNAGETQVEEQECECQKCSAVVRSDEYTFPYCLQCYIHCN